MRTTAGTIEAEMLKAGGGKRTWELETPDGVRYRAVAYDSNLRDLWCFRLVRGDYAKRDSARGKRIVRQYLGSSKMAANVEWLNTCNII
jgi:hypothetical protein